MYGRDETRLLIGRSWTLFVDGENFAKRGQDVLAKAEVKPDRIAWSRDVYLWFPNSKATQPFMAHYVYDRDDRPPPIQAPAATRAFYYTSMPYTNEREVLASRLALRRLGFEPRMFQRRQGKSKAVDLALATDALTLAGEGRYEVAVIFAGDGDYVPVVEAIKRLGRHVVVGFFADSGLSDEMRITADDFVDLTPYLVGDWKALYKSRENAAKRLAEEPARRAEQERKRAEALARRAEADKRRAEAQRQREAAQQAKGS